MWNMHSAITAAEGDFAATLENFVKTFQPPAASNDEAIQILLDVLGIGLTAIAAPVWNSRKYIPSILLSY
jgi:hypothetical protein